MRERRIRWLELERFAGPSFPLPGALFLSVPRAVRSGYERSIAIARFPTVSAENLWLQVERLGPPVEANPKRSWLRSATTDRFDALNGANSALPGHPFDPGGNSCPSATDRTLLP